MKSGECYRTAQERSREAVEGAGGEHAEAEVPSTGQELDNAYMEAFVEAATECLKEFPLAGLDARFRDLDVGQTFEPSWDTTLVGIIGFFVK